MMKRFWCKIKNLFTISKTTLFLTIIIVLVSGLALFIMIKNYNIELKREALQNKPFFNFYFSDDYNYKGFIGKSGENINIKKVEWFIPNVSGENILEISRHPNLLTVNDIIFFIAIDVSRLQQPRSMEDLKNIIRCHLFGPLNEYGIPLGVKIEYEKKGEEKTYITKDTLFAKKLETNLPFIEHYQRDVSEDEFVSFFIEQLDFMNTSYKMIEYIDSTRLTETGECGIRIDEPGM